MDSNYDDKEVEIVFASSLVNGSSTTVCNDNDIDNFDNLVNEKKVNLSIPNAPPKLFKAQQESKIGVVLMGGKLSL